MKKLLLVFLLLYNLSLLAQTTIQTKLLVTENAGTNGGSFKVAVQAKGTNLTVANTIGSATIDVYYNSNHIAPVITSGTNVSGTYNAIIGGNYSRSLNNIVGGPYVRLNVSGVTINQNEDGTPAGLDLTAVYQTLVTINFTISDNTVPTNLSIGVGSLTIGFFNSHNNENNSGVIIPQTMSAPENIINQPLPVELSSFTASITNNTVNLEWTTATEVNNYGFDIERKIQDADWQKIGFVEGNGNSNSPKEYSFIDENPPVGNLQYRLKQIDTDGQYEYYETIAEVNFNATATDVEGKNLPIDFNLSQNYPNPFNPATVINYELPATSLVQIKVYDILGNEIEELVNEIRAPGYYQIEFNGSKLSSGVYIYRLIAGSFVETRKMNLLK